MTNSFLTLADSLECSDRLAPPERRGAVVKTLREIAAWPPGEALPTPADLGAAYAALGQDRAGDDAPTRARRTTCRELAALLPSGGDARGARDAWAVFAAREGGDDPRARAMRLTAQRELAELRELGS